MFPTIRNATIYRSALWILGEYCDTSESIGRVFELVRASVGELPIVDSENKERSGDPEESTTVKKSAIESKV